MHLSYIDTSVKPDNNTSVNIPMDESIGAFLFDTSGFENPFADYPLLYNNFKNGTVQFVRNMDDAVLLGIEDNGFMNGLVYYHLSQFYDFIGDSQIVYMVIGDCSKSWDLVQNMQQQTSGKLFHIGIWTAQPIWRLKDDGSFGFTSLITDLQNQADEINGRVGMTTYTTTPLSIILCGNSSYVEGGDITFKQLPNAIELNCPKVSVALMQNGSEEVHSMQEKNPLHAPVTSLGMLMACLSLCGAEESIGSITKCDLNKNEGFNYPEWGVGASSTPITNVHRLWANTVSSLGYIIPVDYEGLEASYFPSSDQTLSEGDFKSIANNRIMHKCRRAMCNVLMPYVNSSQLYDYNTKTISNSAKTIISDAIYSLLNSAMRNRQGNSQIDGRRVTFLTDTNILDEDAISLKLDIKPVNYSGFISEEVGHETA